MNRPDRSRCDGSAIDPTRRSSSELASSPSPLQNLIELGRARQAGKPVADAFRIAEQPERLVLRAKDAARVLGIGSRLLWSLTNRGEIPHVRAGRAVLYPIAELREWLAEHSRRNGRHSR